MLHVKQDSWRGACVAFVYKDRAAAKQIAVTIEREVKRCIQERMTGTKESSKRLALRRNQVFFKRNALVPWLDSLPGSNQPVAVANGGGNVRDLVTACLTLACDASEIQEGFKEK
jgi:hypothetical protein